MNQASTIGTEMHKVLEYHLTGQGYYNMEEEGTKPKNSMQKHKNKRRQTKNKHISVL